MEEELSFVEFLNLKQLSDRTIKDYTDWFLKLDFDEPDLKKRAYKILNRCDNFVVRGMLKSYFEYLDVNIKLPKRSGRREKKIIKTLTKKEVRDLLLYLYHWNIKYGIMFELLYSCALRCNEVLSIEPEHFDWDGWKENPEKPCKLRIKGKGSKWRIALIPPILMKRMAVYLEQYIDFAEEFKQRRSAFFGMGIRQFEVILRKAGIEVLNKRVYPHLIRHTRTTHLYETTDFDLLDLKTILGHADISTTQLYIHPDETRTLKKMERYIEENAT